MEFNLPVLQVQSWQLQQVQERLAAYQPSQASQCSSHGQTAAGQPSQAAAIPGCGQPASSVGARQLKP
uniref:Uncharacterized protein n=1 Tax=Oryza nivara TaxID=4536 RepID=A0A0E0J8P0_ORYNI